MGGAKTIGLFREKLVQSNVMKALFYDFECQLNVQGYHAKKDQIGDASFVDVPRQRTTKAENAQIKAGETPARFIEKLSGLCAKRHRCTLGKEK